MFCPNCGAINSIDQHYCRACGLNLEDASRSLLIQIPPAESARLTRRRNAIEKLGSVGMIGLGVVGVTAVAAMIVSVFTRMILSGASVVFGTFLISLIVFAVLTLIYVIFREDLEEKQKRLRRMPGIDSREQPPVLDFPERPVRPEIPSVTEEPTELLPGESSTNKLA